MPLFKYHSLESMNANQRWGPRLDPENWRRAFSLTALAYGLRPWRFPPGVHKYRTIGEHNHKRDLWDRLAPPE